MSYIPKQLKQARERFETKLDREVLETLDHYCKYIDSDREHVVGKALEIAFKKDKGFAQWRKTQPEAPEAKR